MAVDPKKDEGAVSTSMRMIGSAISGAFSRSVVHPFDTVRANQQNSFIQRSFIETTKGILRSRGIQGLYSGQCISILLSSPATAIYLSIYESSKEWLPGMYGLSGDNPLVHLSSAFVAEAISGAIWTPMEILKQRSQVSGVRASLIFRSLVRAEGIACLQRGYTANLMVFAPYSLLYWISYEQLKIGALTRKERLENEVHSELGFRDFITLSSISAMFAAILTTPIDVMKTRLQCGAVISLTEAFQHMKAEGLRGMCRGMLARTLWIAPGTCLSITCFEMWKKWVSEVQMHYNFRDHPSP